MAEVALAVGTLTEMAHLSLLAVNDYGAKADFTADVDYRHLA